VSLVLAVVCLLCPGEPVWPVCVSVVAAVVLVASVSVCVCVCVQGRSYLRGAGCLGTQPKAGFLSRTVQNNASQYCYSAIGHPPPPLCSALASPQFVLGLFAFVLCCVVFCLCVRCVFSFY
jgi:hypothetical protein